MRPRSRASSQLDLFAPGAVQPVPQVVVGAPVSQDLNRVAQRLPQHLYLGTSSWTFPGWQGLVYDRRVSTSHLARYGLAAYAQHPLLRTVGIDRTYYAPLAAAAFAAYAEVVPAAFRFVVKAHAWCTHVYQPRQGRSTMSGRERNAYFLDAAYATDHVVAPFVDGLAAKAGLLLFQFPPQEVSSIGGSQRFAERLHAFLDALPRGPLYAVEVRQATLLGPAYAQALADVGACHCYNVHPTMPSIQEQVAIVPGTAAPALVVRWMLHPGLGYEAARVRYEPFDRLVDADPLRRSMLAALCLQALATPRPAFVIANNKAEGSSPLTLFRLAECVARSFP